MSTFLWAAAPPIRPGELFESWLVRFCRANHVGTNSLVQRLGIAELVHDGQPPSEAALERLHTLSGVKRDRLLESHLRTFADQMGLAYDVPYLQPGAGLNDSHVPHKICPECLIGDDVPYVRLHWALELSGACPVHRRALEVDCRCGKPIRLKLQEANRPITECGYCGEDYRSMPRTAEPIFEGMVAFQESILRLSTRATCVIRGIGAVYARTAVGVLQTLHFSLIDFPMRQALGRLLGNPAPLELNLSDDLFSIPARRLNALAICAWFFRNPGAHIQALQAHITAAQHHDPTGVLLEINAALRRALRALNGVA